jgi:UDP-N-acetylglucosamine--N-acetylmuramyl-(pentapeptide) pyrophosphoryl-undecaprenol N-acetylglucosamine transferase
MPGQEHKRLRVLLAGGGTGGHLYPALAIAQGLRGLDANCDLRFVGSKFGLEAKVLPEKNEVFYPLNIRGLQRRISPIALGRNLRLPWRFAESYLRCLRILRQFNPQVVVGTGGYASALPILAAQRKGIPTLLHEQNSYPGLTTRKLTSKASVVCLTYKTTSKFMPTNNWVITGNPVRFQNVITSRKTARQQLGLPARKQILFILGGSQGSRPLNSHFLAHWPEYTQNMGVHLLWQTGLRDFKRLNKVVGEESSITLSPYVINMEAAYRASDLVVTRAGATTLSEITSMGKPAVLVPLPSAAADHQTRNAELLLKKKAARLVPQVELNKGTLEKVIRQLINYPDRLRAMGKRIRSLALPEATPIILDQILRLVEA